MTTTPAAPAAEPEPAAWMYTRKNATYPNIGLHSKVSKGRWMPVPTGWTETPLYTADQLQALIEERDRLRADALRYQWLRDHSVPPHNFYIAVPDEFGGVRYNPSEVDAYIDDARAALAGEKP